MKNRNLLESFNHAINGIIYTLKNERNMKIHVAVTVLILILSLFYKLSKIEILIVCFTVGTVILCELFNTAIEATIDIITHDFHPKAKIAKDVAAGAVMVAAFLSLIVGYVIFFDKISVTLETGIFTAKQSPVHLTVIALIITIIAVLVLKARTRNGSPFHGGMPSGHAALAFSITTAITLWADNAAIALLCLFLSLLVLQSRLEGKIHTLPELAAGAVLGFLITLLIFQFFSYNIY